jgi:hypothetical protein
VTGSIRRLALLHLVANALLLWLVYYWLGVGESRASMLAWSACVALLIVGLACSAYGAALVYFQEQQKRSISAAWRTAFRNLFPLAVAAVLAGILYWLLAQWAAYSTQPAFRIASYLTLHSRAPVRPTSVSRIFNAALWVVRWAVLPVLLLPMISAVAARGWRGFPAIGERTRRWLYWIEVPVLLVCTFWIPLKLVGWVPQVNGFRLETASFILRAALAYLLFGICWLFLAFITSAGNPRFTQPRTVPSP